ncbi:MAG: RNA-binding cell elongation regulator Jag/EloR [Desulfobacterales bacterium]|nr:RNA-binding cell elongation regulator Jag/EloR [Desulfobacterales bacterium]
MTSYIEFEGKNIEHAIKKACGKLKIDKEKIRYKVISYGSTGIFGLAGRKKAKIKVSVPEEKKPEEKKPEQKKPEGKKPEEKKPEEKKIDNKEDDRKYYDNKESEIKEKNVQTGKEILQKIIDSITEDAKIAIEVKSNKTIYNVVGGNSALLIGKRGKTLEAIQLIVEKVINKKNEKRSRTLVDIEGYVEKRNSYLKSLAKRLADKCKRFGKPMSLGEMNPHDRRIIHITLKNDKEVGTRSKGEGVLRKIEIFPKKSSHQKKEMFADKVENAN